MIYFVQSSCAEGFIKIGYLGYSCQPNNRFSVLQADTPHAVSVLGVCDGDQVAEFAIHSAFASARYRAEWFWPSPALLTFIKEHASPYVPIDRRKK
jgi:hypothetical protein